ncbi:MAG: carbohydrate kinase [Microbacteriaceae bacterium]|nr:MAG: carbohydrate kinase [Microbacteriaceae bacterium]
MACRSHSVTDYVVGIDVGSTSVKVLAAELDGTGIAVASRRTPWTDLDGGCAELQASALVDLVFALIRELDAALAARGQYRVVAAATSGMAEAGVVLDPVGVAKAPVMAWFDPRGGNEMAATPQEFRAEFPGRTGLPVGPMASFSKLLHLQAHGIDLSDATFLNLPEFIAHALGAPRVAESSLVSRTGLIDQDTGELWDAAVDVLGLESRILGARVDAGRKIGRITTDRVPRPFRGAQLTIAGHDHLVSAAAAGATRGHQLYDSIGTAEALVQLSEQPLSFAARERLATAGITTGRYPLPGLHALLAGTKAGLLMRRTLQLVGITDVEGRARIDDAVMALPVAGALVEDALQVLGGENRDGVLRITARSDNLSPAELLGAVLRHGNDLCRELLVVMHREIPTPTSTVLTGGWASMRSVVRARAQVLPDIRVATVEEGTAFGAAAFALWAFRADAAFHDATEGFLAHSHVSVNDEGA